MAVSGDTEIAERPDVEENAQATEPEYAIPASPRTPLPAGSAGDVRRIVGPLPRRTRDGRRIAGCRDSPRTAMSAAGGDPGSDATAVDGRRLVEHEARPSSASPKVGSGSSSSRSTQDRLRPGRVPGGSASGLRAPVAPSRAAATSSMSTTNTEYANDCSAPAPSRAPEQRPARRSRQQPMTPSVPRRRVPAPGDRRRVGREARPAGGCWRSCNETARPRSTGRAARGPAGSPARCGHRVRTKPRKPVECDGEGERTQSGLERIGPRNPSTGWVTGEPLERLSQRCPREP